MPRLYLITLITCAGCYTSLASSQRSANELTLSNDGLLCGDRDATLTINASDPAYFLQRGKLETPEVELVRGDERTAVEAKWSSDNKSLHVAIPAGLAEGGYSLALRRPHDGALTMLDDAVTVTAPPTITRALGQAACTSATETSALRLFGAHLQGAKVHLAGLTLQLQAIASPAGDELTVTLPAQIAAGGPYDIVVETGIGCTAVVTPGVSVVSAPTTTALVAGPQLLTLDSNSQPLATASVARSTEVTLRVTGTNLVAGTRVLVGGVEADSVAATSGATAGSSIDATFAANRLIAGTQVTEIRNGGCATPGAEIVIEEPTLQLASVNPSAISSSAGERFIDVIGTLAAAGPRLRFYIDTNPDPIEATYVPLFHHAWLDAAHHACRAELTADLPASDQAYDLVTLGAGGTRGITQGLLRVSNLATPTLVYKDKASLVGSRSGGETFSVFGCDLEGASWVLLDDAGDEQALSPPTLHTITSSEVGFHRYRCTHSRYADTRADFSGPSLSAASLKVGVHRLRAKVAAGNSDDLYPLVVYSDAPALSSASDTALHLSAHRRQARAVSAVDASGRKYVYVIGGSNSNQSAPSAEGPTNAVQRSIDFAPLDPNHRLLGAGRDDGVFTPYAIDTLQLGSGGPFSVNPLKTAYAPAVLAIDSTVYWIGGHEGSAGASDDAMHYTRVSDPTDRPHINELTLSSGGNLSAGRKWIAFAQVFSRYDGLAPMAESLPSRPMRLTALANQSLQGKVATRCGFTTDPGQDPGFPALAVYLADAAEDELEPPLQAFEQAATIPAPANPACTPGQPLVYTVNVANFDTSAHSPPALPGYLPPFRSATPVLKNAVFGASAALVTSGPARQIVVAGGLGDEQRLNFVTIDVDGAPQSNSDFNSLPANHSFATAVSSPLNSSSMVSTAGFASGVEGDTCVDTTHSYAIASGAAGVSTVVDGAALVAPATVLLGATLFSMGGAAFTCTMVPMNDEVSFSNAIRSRRIDTTDAFANTTSTLVQPASSMAAVTAPPYVYLFGGVTVSGGSGTDQVATMDSVFELLSTP